MTENCKYVLSRKNELEHKLSSSSISSEKAQYLSEEIENLDFFYCDTYEDLKDKIAIDIE